MGLGLLLQSAQRDRRLVIPFPISHSRVMTGKLACDQVNWLMREHDADYHYSQRLTSIGTARHRWQWI